MSTSLAGSSYADGSTRPEPADFQYEAKTLDGKRVLVTGGTRGMGAAIAELLIAQKARVVVTARHEDGQSQCRGL
jgi:NADPH:quinone reductase-like Zn-dependent oxidoreductase